MSSDSVREAKASPEAQRIESGIASIGSLGYRYLSHAYDLKLRHQLALCGSFGGVGAVPELARRGLSAIADEVELVASVLPERLEVSDAERR